MVFSDEYELFTSRVEQWAHAHRPLITLRVNGQRQLMVASCLIKPYVRFSLIRLSDEELEKMKEWYNEQKKTEDQKLRAVAKTILGDYWTLN